jgi:hypothetical protein
MARKGKCKLRVTQTDDAAKIIWLRLLRDFRVNLNDDSFGRNAELALKHSVYNFRNYGFPELGIIDQYRYKCYSQLSGLLKKYRFAEDRYTDDELIKNTLQKFLGEQERLATFRPRSLSVHAVLQEARKVSRAILGRFDPERTMTLAKFGKKSSIGCPLSLAYIDHKLTDIKAFTGSSDCSKWFMRDYVPSDPLMTELLGILKRKPGVLDLEHDSLNLVQVPKSWKVLRPITPLTLLALFYSYGVGEQVTERLKQNGLNLSKLQHRHRRFAQLFSTSRDSTIQGGSHATADLSSASDSLTSELVNAVLPREWFTAIKKTFSRELKLEDGRSIYTSSILPMGNGLTFPVETLVFYSLIKAIGNLLGVRHGVYSVYGDDLIYPSKLHKYVSVIFPKLRLILNGEKTFVNFPFRESCGSDFYRGVDVRPSYLPEGGKLTDSQYVVWLYKAYNALCRRWDPIEIPSVIHYIISELERLGMQIYRVPPTYPDTAGLKVPDVFYTPLGIYSPSFSPIHVRFTNGSRWFSFKYMRETVHRRAIVTQAPYYWLSLSGRVDEPRNANFWDTDFGTLYGEAPPKPLQWTKVKYRRKSKKGKGYYIVRRTVLTCSERPRRSNYKVKRTKPGSVSDWF